MTLTEEQIAEIRARVEAATPGPWRLYGVALKKQDVDFLDHARDDIPALLSALEAANKRADEAEAARDAMREDRDSQQRVCIAVMTERDALRARVAVMQEALEIIAGKRQCLDNLMGNKDVALAALKAASHEQG